ncbi:MAG: hypothetical protein HYX38_33080 [Rhodospirillales bacterium]|nr:hypothetical protein [Rhodospirillales bacterium]
MNVAHPRSCSISMFTSLLERIPVTVIVIVLGLCALRSFACRAAVYCVAFIHRGFLNQQVRGQTTRIVAAAMVRGSDLL